jgi:hypothetical protein
MLTGGLDSFVNSNSQLGTLTTEALVFDVTYAPLPSGSTKEIEDGSSLES